MNTSPFNKRKIINDPVYGFVTIPNAFLFDLIEHPFFQRLRRIKQLGLTNLVYPGARHTRFQHALGALHLMTLAIDVLRSKGHSITENEAQGVYIAILLHDIGHGPFSHTLENCIVPSLSHEDISNIFISELNKQFDNQLSLAIDIFNNTYPKHFLHQLVSSQLDMDRLDYLKRDSFYTGVSEGSISTDRIIKMLNVFNDELVVESKGIYSIENFIISRRLMYWQVYLHKTSVSADNLLIKILKRAKELAETGVELFATPPLHFFLYNVCSKTDFKSNHKLLQTFAELDDTDIIVSIKTWTKHNDFILSTLSQNLINRKLPAIELQNEPFDSEHIKALKLNAKTKLNIDPEIMDYFVYTDKIANNIYNPQLDRINILFKNNEIKDIAEASDQLNVSVLSKTITKYFLCYPKEIR